jgi:hypothetical protein
MVYAWVERRRGSRSIVFGSLDLKANNSGVKKKAMFLMISLL